MKALFTILFFFLSANLAKAEQTADVASVLDALHTAASRADADSYFGLFTEDAIYIGTDVHEYWTIDEFKSYVMPYFSKGQGWVYRPTSRDIRFSKSGKVAWFHEVHDSESYGTSRGTGVLVFEDDWGWRISQYHLTFPIPNDIAGEVTDRIKAYESDAESRRN